MGNAVIILQLNEMRLPNNSEGDDVCATNKVDFRFTFGDVDSIIKENCETFYETFVTVFHFQWPTWEKRMELSYLLSI